MVAQGVNIIEVGYLIVLQRLMVKFSLVGKDPQSRPKYQRLLVWDHCPNIYCNYFK